MSILTAQLILAHNNTQLILAHNMGQCDSKPPPKLKPKGPAKELTFGKDPSLNMADYMLRDSKGVTMVKEDMKGQQFLVEECEVITSLTQRVLSARARTTTGPLIVHSLLFTPGRVHNSVQPVHARFRRRPHCSMFTLL